MKKLKDNLLSVCCVLSLLSLSSVTLAKVSVKGLAHLYSGEGNANDSVGGVNGILGSTTTFAKGINGQAFSFDGRQTSIVMNLADINPSHSPKITMGMWINMRSHVNGNSLGWVFGHDNGGYDRSINLTDSRYNYGVAGGTGKNPHSSSLLNIKENLNSWHCVAASYDQTKNSATFFADGKTQTVPATLGNGEILSSLGGLVNFENHTVDALVDEVFIFNRILTLSEIEQVCSDVKKARKIKKSK